MFALISLIMIRAEIDSASVCSLYQMSANGDSTEKTK